MQILNIFKRIMIIMFELLEVAPVNCY